MRNKPFYPCPWYSLSPGQRYYYVYGDYYGWSGEKSFKAAPSNKKDVTTNVIAFGGQINHLTSI